MTQSNHLKGSGSYGQMDCKARALAKRTCDRYVAIHQVAKFLAESESKSRTPITGTGGLVGLCEVGEEFGKVCRGDPNAAVNNCELK